MKKIFCVEDDINIRELLEYTLTQSGFEVCGFENAGGFFAAVSDSMPDLAILDIMLPDKDGMEILKELRQASSTKHLPVIMLTAKSSQLDKIKGLDSGADDYITKPIDIMELISRVNALLRRTSAPLSGECLVYKDLALDLPKHKVTACGHLVSLTYKEFEVLHTLIQNKGTVLTRDTLMNTVWGTNFEGETRTVDVHIRTLRQKLGKCGEYIETVRNVGYKIGG